MTEIETEKNEKKEKKKDDTLDVGDGVKLNEARLGRFIPCGELVLTNQHAQSAISPADVTDVT